MVKVSVIVPIYNSEKYLERCIVSLINQTLKDIEIILVNDASPDNSMDIVRKYEKLDPRIVVIDNKVNIVACRNLGIKIAKGEYLGFVDADDWVEPTMYEELYQITYNEKVDVVASDVMCCFSSGRNVIETNIKEKDFDNADKVKASVAQFGGRLFANIWKRELITNDILFLEHCLYCDSIVIAWYMKANSFKKVSKPFYNYFVNDTSVTHRMDSERFFDRLVGAKDMLDRCRAIGLYAKYQEEIDYSFYRLYLKNTLLLINRSWTHIPSAFIKSARQEFLNNVDINKNKYFILHKGDNNNISSRLLLLNAYLGIFYLHIDLLHYKFRRKIKIGRLVRSVKNLLFK